MNKSTPLRLAALGMLLAASAAVVISFSFFKEQLQLPERLETVLETVRDLGPWGPGALAAVYVLACVFFVPGSLLTLAAGFLFGVVLGTIAVSVGSTLGAAAAFLVGRFLARDWIEARVARNPRFQALDLAVAENGFKIVLLTRLSPVFPFNLLNYAYGLTRVRFRDYFLATWIGMMPGTILYVYLGSLVEKLADLLAGKVESGSGGRALFLVGLAAAAAVAILVARAAKKALARSLETKN